MRATDHSLEVELRAERDRLVADLEKYCKELEALHSSMESEEEKAASVVEEKDAEIEKLNDDVQKAKRRSKEVWRINCDQFLLHDEEIAAKDAEIAELKSKLLMAVGMPPKDGPPSSRPARDEGMSATPVKPLSKTPPPTSVRVSGDLSPRRGKAPPVDSFSGDNELVRFDDWLPSLGRAALWNNWPSEEKLLLVISVAEPSRSGI